MKVKKKKEKLICFFESFIMIYKFIHYVYIYIYTHMNKYKEKTAFWTSESFLIGSSTF